MDILIWGGAALSLAGLFGLIWCIVTVLRARRQATDDDALRAAVQRVLPWNLAALFTSVLGLMTVIVGVVLG